MFSFFISYLNLFYYAFIIQNFKILATNFISILVSKNLLFFFKIHLIPFFIFKFKKKRFFKKWKKVRKNLKIQKLKENKLCSKMQKDYNKLSKRVKEKLFKIEKDLILQEQVELSLLMPKPIKKIQLWLNNVIQFGFINFFSLVFPIATLWSFLINIFHIFFIHFSSTNFTRRNFSLERDSIGVWKQIYNFMTFASLAVNFGILIFTSEGMKNFVNDEKEENNKYNLFVILIIAEHSIFIIMYVIKMTVSNNSYWVKNEIRNVRFRKTIEEEKIKKKLICEVNEKKKK